MKTVVVITGASQGIGAAIARAFARAVPGVVLALVARNARKLGAVAKACGRLGAKAEVFPCDVTDAAAVAQLAVSVRRRLGPVDVLVNNAGKFVSAPFTTMTVAQFDEVLAANLRSTFLVSRAFVPAMVRRGRGDVFNMGSIAGLDAYRGGTGYSAAKFGVRGLSKVMRAELRDKGVRVCCVEPGATSSPSWAGSGVDPRRMMPADDVAQAFVGVYQLSRRTVVEEIVLRPQRGDV
ncbi:SDR family oxidoreductase [Opitutus sp. ER46]|uniref:SDR family oxidoreductase n=1 Tax=Opitutus sp. ER46 TaxID=2161864 RepID=UPI000D317DCC|nr:SDR family oxidoreductase [Opitutus sp. ER46]PTX92368.1 NAD(P)-dependent oxidoreductase [Opitutus sp. ER46]